MSVKNSKEKPIATDFKIGKEIGCGNYSRITTAIHIQTKEKFALKIVEKQKVLRLKQRHPNIINEIQMEKQALNKLKHPNIIQLYQTFQDDKHLYFLMEHHSGGELWDKLMSHGKQIGCDEDTARFYLIDIINGVEYMHNQGIVHRDLKPENMVISSDDGHLRIIDFGTAKDLRNVSLNGPNFVGTPEFMSPETVNNKAVDETTDLWALGCILYQMLAGQSPFDGGTPYLTFLKIKEGAFKVPEFFSKNANDLITRLLVMNPKDRMTIQELKSHSFFVGVDFENHMKQMPPVPKLCYLCMRYIVDHIGDCSKEDSVAVRSLAQLSTKTQVTLQHLLKRRQILHILRNYELFFEDPIDARTLFAKNNSYLGLSCSLQGQWKKPFSFVYLSIPCFETKPDADSIDRSLTQLKRGLEEVNATGPKLAILNGGYICDKQEKEDNLSQIRKFKECLTAIDPTVRLLFVPGALGTSLEYKPIYSQIYGDDYYSFWYGGVKGIVLNASLFFYTGDNNTILNDQDEQKIWFSKELENGKLCAHHLMVFIGDHDSLNPSSQCEKKKALLDSMTTNNVAACFIGSINSASVSTIKYKGSQRKNDSDSDNEEHEGVIEMISTSPIIDGHDGYYRLVNLKQYDYSHSLVQLKFQ